MKRLALPTIALRSKDLEFREHGIRVFDNLCEFAAKGFFTLFSYLGVCFVESNSEGGF